MNEVSLHLETFCSPGVIPFSVLRFLCQHFRVVRRCSLKEPPAVRALLNGIDIFEYRQIVVISDSDRRSFRGVFDHEHVFAAVISRICARIDDHGDRIAFADADIVHPEIFGNLAVGPRGEVFLAENRSVLHKVDRHAVRPVRIGILVEQLRVLKIDVDPSVFGDDPFYDGAFAFVSRHDVIFFDFYAVARIILFVILAVFNIDREERIRVVAVLIIPAVVALRAEIVLGGGKIDSLAVISRRNVSFRQSDETAEARDGKFIFSAVIGIIINAVDDHREVLPLRDSQGGYVEAFRHFLIYFRRKCLLREQRLVKIDRDSRSVRPVRIGILVFHFRVGCFDRDRSVLGDSPLNHRGAVVNARIDVIPFDFQIAVVEIAVFFLVKRGHVVGMERVIPISPLEDPAVAALFSEVVFDIGEILSGID